MADEPESDGVMIIRVWREQGGRLRARITDGTEGPDAELHVSGVESESDVINAVKNWLSRIRS